jgi:hypothetical protein
MQVNGYTHQALFSQVLPTMVVLFSQVPPMHTSPSKQSFKLWHPQLICGPETHLPFEQKKDSGHCASEVQPEGRGGVGLVGGGGLGGNLTQAPFTHLLFPKHCVS